jgi:hypothetical protein
VYDARPALTLVVEHVKFSMAWYVSKEAGVSPERAMKIFIAVMIAAAVAYGQTGAPDRALLDQYCVGCHNQKTKTADLMLDKVDVAKVGDSADTWEKVVLKLRTGMMPPAGARRPDQATINTFASRLETALDRAAAAHPNPGTTALHRLNRTEYGFAVRDLLDLEIDPTTLLPADDSSEGFDNIADALNMAPALLERYVSTATKLSRLAVGDMSNPGGSVTFRNSTGLREGSPKYATDPHIEGLPLGTQGGMLIHYNFPLDGEYTFKVKGSSGMAYDHRVRDMEITVNGERVYQTKVGFYEIPTFKVKIKAGPRDVGLNLLGKDPSDASGLWDTSVNNVGIASVVMTGPLNPTGPGDTPSRRRIFICRPASAAEEIPCARKILTTLATRAYREPATDADLETLLGFYQRGRNDGSFDQGIELALQRVMVDGRFVFRFEREPANIKAGASYRVSDLELASRLSFFLWSSIPDDELLNLAAQRKLHEPAVLEQQTRRMLADRRSDALVANFAGQWLALRDIKNAPASGAAPLKQAFRQESEMFFNSMIREDRSLLDLLNADYTFVDEKLARHYGIPNVYGSHFRRVQLKDENRRGLLGQSSFLLVTSVADRTSPVARGKWILENILGLPAPVPPPSVPPLQENTAEAPVTTSVRERMEQHRSNAVCAACHKIMDPIGFSLENFDLTGKWRTKDGLTKVDASSELVNGTKLDGPVSLRQALLALPNVFVTTATRKMMTYALGRPLRYYDMPTIRSIVRDAGKSDYRFSSFILGIVKSDPFQMRLKRAEEIPSESARAALK